MKLPKAIDISGYEWQVERTEGGGGYFNCDRHVIQVGTDCDDQRQWEIFIHEMTEAIFADNLMRMQKPYTEPSNGDYMFVFNHNDFEVMFAKPLAAVLWDLLPWYE